MSVVNKVSKIISVVVAVICVAVLIYLIFFFGDNQKPQEDVVTLSQKQYTISFDADELEYTNETDFMNGVTAQDENGVDLTKYVTVSCKPTKDMRKKKLTYSINRAGYEIESFERILVVSGEYNGPSITYNGTAFEIPIDRLGSISSEIAQSGIVDTDDGFGGKCSLTAVFNNEITEIGDYAVTVTAQNIFGDTASVKVAVSVVEPASSIIKLKASSVSINRGDSFNALDYIISAYDEDLGDVKGNVICDNAIDVNTSGVYTIEYRINGIRELENEKAFLYVTVN